MKRDFKEKKKSQLRKNRAHLEAEIGEIWTGFAEPEEEAQTDVLGSYTGTPKDEDKEPTQDADDL